MNQYEGKRDDGKWVPFDWDSNTAPTPENTGYEEIRTV